MPGLHALERDALRTGAPLPLDSRKVGALLLGRTLRDPLRRRQVRRKLGFDFADAGRLVFLTRGNVARDPVLPFTLLRRVVDG
jgi:hypothetical protein